MRLLLTASLDVKRLATALGLTPSRGDAVPVGKGKPAYTELALALAPLVDQLDLVTFDFDLTQPVLLSGEGVRIAVGPYRARPRTRARDVFAAERAFIADHVRAWRPDVVSAHHTYEHALGALDAGAPTLITVRDWAPAVLRYSPDKYRALRLLMQAMTFARGQHFTAVSPYIAGRVERYARRAATVIPNPLPSEWDEAPCALTPSLDLLAVNRGFGRLKNITGLLSAFHGLRRRLPEVTLTLVGADFQADGSAAAWARRHDLDAGVTFHGPVPHASLPSLLRQAKVFVHPSLNESFGMVVLEAMAAGLPVVAGRRSGGVPWVLGEAGALVDVRKPDEIARAAYELLTDPQRRRVLGEAGYRRARTAFDPSAVASRYLAELTRIG